MKTGIVVAHNTGLGDMIVMNGAIRYLSERYDEVHIVTLDSCAKHIKFIYRDNPNIRPYFIAKPESTRQAILRMQAAYYDIVKLNPNIKFTSYKQHYYSSKFHWDGLVKSLNLPSDTIWQKMFYKILDVPYEARYNNYNILRNVESEQKLFDSLELPERYAFVCDEISTHSYSIKKWKTSLKTINPSSFRSGYGPLLSDTIIFDWNMVIEKASEIHTVDTCWLHLARMLKLNIPKFYYKTRKVKLSSGSDYINDIYDSGWSIVIPESGSFTTRIQDR